MTQTDFHIRQAHWPDDRESLRAVRETVFVAEQGVPLALEWDGTDAACTHLLAEDAAGNPIGTVRLLPDGHIGRMAVLAPWRSRGVGTALLQQILQVGASQGLEHFVLNAQADATGFYERLGFHSQGPLFDDAGIPHRRMTYRHA